MRPKAQHFEIQTTGEIHVLLAVVSYYQMYLLYYPRILRPGDKGVSKQLVNRWSSISVQGEATLQEGY